MRAFLDISLIVTSNNRRLRIVGDSDQSYNASAPTLWCVFCKFHVIDGQSARDQITCFPFILSERSWSNYEYTIILRSILWCFAWNFTKLRNSEVLRFFSLYLVYFLKTNQEACENCNHTALSFFDVHRPFHYNALSLDKELQRFVRVCFVCW